MFMLTSKMLKSIICLFLLATNMASSARILGEASSHAPLPDEAPPDEAPDSISDPKPNNPDTAPTFTQPSGQIPATLPHEPDISDTQTPPIINVSPVTTPATTTAPGGASTSTKAAGSTTAYHPIVPFFMHDILGGSHPSGRVVTGVVANSNANSLPYLKAKQLDLPHQRLVPLNTINGVINDDNFPSLVGLNGSSTNTLL